MSKTDELINRFLGEPARNLMHAIYDDYVEANVKFRGRSGMKTFIIRRQLAKCCDWCAGLAGIYELGKEPDDIYRRHDNCKCMVTFRNEQGKYTDVWSKKEYSTQRSARIARQREIMAETEEQRVKTKELIDRALSQSYNTPPIEKLKKVYEEDVAEGWISPLSGFDNYLMLFNRIENEIIGLTTSNGIRITGQSRHFMQRVIGTGRDPKEFKEKHKIVRRSGTEIDDIIETLKNGKARDVIYKDGLPSQTFYGKCVVTINPNTGKLIQCNRRKKK